MIIGILQSAAEKKKLSRKAKKSYVKLKAKITYIQNRRTQI